MKYLFSCLIFLFGFSNLEAQESVPRNPNYKGIQCISNYSNSGYFQKHFYNIEGTMIKKEFYDKQGNLMTEFLNEYNDKGFVIDVKWIYHKEFHAKNANTDDLHFQYHYEYTKDGEIKKLYSIFQSIDTTFSVLQGINNDTLHYIKYLKNKEYDWWIKSDDNRRVIFTKDNNEISSDYFICKKKYDENGFLLQEIYFDAKGNITRETKYSYKYNRRGLPKKTYIIKNGKKEFSHRTKYKFYK